MYRAEPRDSIHALVLLAAFPAFWLVRTYWAPPGAPEDRAERQEHLERTLASIWGQGRPDVAGDEVMTELVSHLQFAVHILPVFCLFRHVLRAPDPIHRFAATLAYPKWKTIIVDIIDNNADKDGNGRTMCIG